MLKRYGVKTKDIWVSIIYGGVVGLIGVILFVLFVKVDWGFMESKKVDVLAPVDDSTTTSVEAPTFFALQHGVFSSDEQAQSFIASDPQLVKAIAIKIGDKYYVWSRVASTEETLKPDKGTSFVKRFQLNSTACKEETVRTLPKWLASENSLNFNFSNGDITGVLPQDWESVRSTAISVSEDMDVVRMYLIFHYFSSSSCLNLKFE